MTDTKDWNHTNTLCLIKLIGEQQITNISEISNEIFIEAANQLFEHGFSKTFTQCKTKWKELFTTYKEFKETENGEAPPFFDELDKIFCGLQDSSMETSIRSWTESETNALINVIKVSNFLSELKINTSDVYEKIVKKLEETGYQLRSKEEIKQRWKQLKRSYINYIKDWHPNTMDIDEDIFEDEDTRIEDNLQSYDFEMEVKEIRKKSNNWSHKETDTLLSVIKEYNYPKIKRSKKTDMFDNCSMQLRSEGFKRSSHQCRIRFKHLKTKYFRALKKLSSGQNPENYCQHFETMHQIMGGKEEQSREDIDDLEEEHYEIEYLDDYENDFNLFEKVFVNDTNNYRGLNRPVWSTKETQCLLNILKTKNIKRYSRRSFFEEVSQEMTKSGYDRPAHMCMNKWKNLRRQLNICVRNVVKGNTELCPFYDELIEIMQKDGTLDITQISDQEIIEYDSEEDNSCNTDQKIDQESTSSSRTQEKRSLENDNSVEYLVPEKRIKISDTDENRFVCNYKMDDVEHYCMSLAATFRRIPNKKQAKLKMEIQKLLFQAEFDDEF